MLKWALLFVTGLAWGHDLGAPVALVASPELTGPYARTVLVATPLASGWHLGVVVNRPTGLRLSELAPDLEAAARIRQPLYIGGHQGIGKLQARVRSPRPPRAGTIHLFADVYLVQDAAEVVRIIQKTPNAARYVAGYVLWPPEVLAEEVAAGAWLVVAPHADFIFREDPASLWEDQVVEIGNTL
ncbi:MAG TPA: YqgE/AlgH family protein [Burkholderiales bacterium]|nr:YqgE/AlgH family protein [Burkholderiales bacterium]